MEYTILGLLFAPIYLLLGIGIKQLFNNSLMLRLIKENDLKHIDERLANLENK